MQSVCTLLPEELAAKVVEARATLAGEPAIGALYDPPFSHFTLQLAEDYDWDGMAGALETLAASEEPFEARTLGLLLWGNSSMDFAVMPHPDQRLRDFQARVWEAASPFTRGNVRQMDTPGTWIPHVTIKRGGPDRDACIRALSRIVESETFDWTFTVDNISVQHDPGKNSRTHYQRFYFPLKGAAGRTTPSATSNATLKTLREEGGLTLVSGSLDSGGNFEQRVTPPELVRLMAACRASDVYFEGARCRVEHGAITDIEPVTPHPVQG